MEATDQAVWINSLGAGRHAEKRSWVPTRSWACPMAVAKAAADEVGLPLYRYLGA